jgi:hypothetical protein
MAARPHKDDYVLSDTTQYVCEFRDRLIDEANNAGADGHSRLERINAVLSVVLAMHFPLGETQWDELGQARGWLADLIGT